MSTMMEKIGTWFSAIAFAEAGEQETAMKMVGMKPPATTETVNILAALNNSFAAAAFAEENCPELAREFIKPARRKPSFTEVIGLKGVNVRYGVVRVKEESFLETLGIGGLRGVRMGLVRA